MGNNTETELNTNNNTEASPLDTEEEIENRTAVADGDADPAAEEEQETDELAQALALVEDFKEALQRERADFQNFRKRVDRERESLRPTISAEIMKRFIPVIDDFERAVSTLPEEEQDKDWLIGIVQIQRKFQNVLEAEGVKAITPLGEEFDPNFHEAIGRDEASEEYPSGHITAVLQNGYVQGDKVLRAAMVRVAD